MKNARRANRTHPPVALRPENRPEEHPDKRFRRTEHILRETLLDMLEQKRLVDITTTELCRRADVSRNTFYAHYTAVEHLYDDMENDLVRSLVNAAGVTVPGPGRSREEVFEANVDAARRFLDILKENRRIAEALMRGHVLSDFYRKLYPLMREKILQMVEPAGQAPGDSLPFGAKFLYMFHGSRAWIDRWTANGMTEDTRMIAEHLVRMEMAALEA
ncbi:MAG: TetR/AcrR family transcriptional regulator [Lachnospiraceae bacterium]|nr:TetR/AcrR family transcriptional regulator [Lachnospiraceae bacterium]